MKKDNRGGKRDNSGAKPKYSEPTTTIAFRVPESKAIDIKEVVNKMIQGYKL